MQREWGSGAVGDSSPRAGDSGFHPIPLDERTLTNACSFRFSQIQYDSLMMPQQVGFIFFPL